MSFLAGSANAAIISGTHYTNEGKLVNLSGLEWLSWDVAIGKSRASIEAGEMGLLDAGWRYATRKELSDLFQSVAPAPGQSPLNSDGTKWLWEVFDNPSFLAPAAPAPGSKLMSRIKYMFVGNDGECSAHADESCIARWKAFSDDGFGNVDKNAGYYPTYSYRLLKTSSSSGIVASTSEFAHVLVRATTAVPEPSSLAMFALGLISWVRYRRRSVRVKCG
ncbi:PEP-CTERM sorting domain-containing protein [Bowmanella sp. Y26]|uniref:PEP-CTERM sorting domain-containing protein n=1 Tax=Bowmanella yangjiangensis TaxID=2811230 RepID=UPI001BDD35B1|nr:PEP-CTERM sorting domain-containing protein [Bowmanella yangjiangensis]MBT1062277.1 PEP-CTERM sorting domain-containing protein [Bowmanella yangjiangensis]